MDNSVQDYTRGYGAGETVSDDAFLSSIMRKVYGWMCAGLVLSGVVAWYTASSGLYKTILSTVGFTVCVVAELALVIGLSWGIQKISAGIASLMFLLYAAVNGLTLSIVFLAYQLGTVEQVFFITAGMFGGLALFGTLTKADLSTIGSIFGMALWGIILLTVVNLFVKSERMDWALSLVGVVVFAGLTAWDAQKVQKLALSIPAQGREGAVAHKLGIICALSLYLDFINLFLYLLRIFGGGKGRK